MLTREESLNREEVESLVRGMLGTYLSADKVDDGKVDRENAEYLLNTKVDSRNVVDHTFTTTSPETFEHPLSIIPNGFIILNKSANGSITGDRTTWTRKKVTLTAQAAPNTVRFLFL